MAVQSRAVLEPSAQGIVDATASPPCLSRDGGGACANGWGLGRLRRTAPTGKTPSRRRRSDGERERRRSSGGTAQPGRRRSWARSPSSKAPATDSRMVGA